jgi:hypothetical protein
MEDAILHESGVPGCHRNTAAIQRKSSSDSSSGNGYIVQLQLLFQFLFTTIGIVVLTILEVFQQLALSIFLSSEMPFRKTCQHERKCELPNGESYRCSRAARILHDCVHYRHDRPRFWSIGNEYHWPQEISGSRLCVGCHGQGFSGLV